VLPLALAAGLLMAAFSQAAAAKVVWPTLANFKVDPVERSIAHQQVIGLVKKEAAVFTAKG
jgi:hypothetical protein